jgi:dTDP-4-dehydrorhamnose 3,5-epimerase
MEMIQLPLKGLQLYSGKRLIDNRGTFRETFREEWFKDFTFVQDNEVRSLKNVIRGLHFQTPPYTQVKLIRVTYGEINDVVVDLRKNSKTYGESISIKLNQDDDKILLIPEGFAHGYSTLTEFAIINYKVGQYFSLDHETGINPFSKTLKINWKVQNPIVSPRDMQAIDFNNFISPF